MMMLLPFVHFCPFFFTFVRFSPIQGLRTRSVRLSVRWRDNSLQTQHIDLKLSTHLNVVKSGANRKFEDGRNRNKKNSCHGYLIQTKVGSICQKINFVQMT
jgi:hypothetical protein